MTFEIHKTYRDGFIILKNKKHFLTVHQHMHDLDPLDQMIAWDELIRIAESEQLRISIENSDDEILQMVRRNQLENRYD